MSSAFRWFLPELLAAHEMRAARQARAFALLDERLERVLLSNAAGEALFGLAAGGAPAPLLARQIRSGARALDGGAVVPLLVRAASGRIAAPVAATATRFAAAGGAAILLAAGEPRSAADADPARILAALGGDDEACVFAADGSLVAGDLRDAASENLRQDVLAFAAADTDVADVAGGSVRLFRIGDDLVLAAMQAVPDETETPASEPPGEARQPIERESPVIVPDVPAEEAGTLDPSVSTDEEAPAEPDGDLVPSADEPGLGVAGDPRSFVPAEPDLPVFVARLDAAPVRFVWQIDADGRFRSLSPEFADVVGPRAAAVLGRSFDEVAEAFGFDGTGAIGRLLDRRDTFAGRTVFWPVEGTDRRVPVDLAALPTYSRDRAFDGFRGFGIVRSADHESDEAARGLALARPKPPAEPDPEPVAEVVETPPPPAPRALIRTFEADLPGVSFGRRQSPPQPAVIEQDGAPRGERRRWSEATLSEAEEAAFREIGAKLGRQRSEAETPGALRFEDLRPEPAAAPDEAASPEEVPAPEEPVAEPEADGVTAEDGGADDAQTQTDDAEDAAEDPAVAADPLLAALPLPVLVQGRDGLVFANRAFAEFSGYPSVEALGAAGGLETLFDEGPGEPGSRTMRIRRAGGETVEAGVHMQRVAFAGHSSLLMTFEPPAPAPVESLDADDLRREVGELRAVLDIATDGVVIVDPEGTIRAANGSAEALFGMAAAEFRDKPLADLFAHESRKAVVGYLETLKDKGLAGILNDGREVIGRVAQGGFVPLFITVGRVPEERGWCVVIRDMSHWKRIEEELVNAKRAAEAASLHKSRFLANISHELRTPLNAIIGFADVMASECFGPIGNERYVEYLGDIKRSGHHVLDLVNDLLDISKIEAGRMELSFEAVSLNEVLAEVVATMQPQANRERVIVRSNLPASVPPVVADRRTIRQIALNLLSNSVRFTPAGGQIIASTTYTAEGDVLLRVRDSGIGMTPSEIEIALTPFQQVHKPDGGRATGTGLGLPLTKAMAEANRASFAIRSTPGEGTLVEIAFPSQRVLAD